ncbi:MAG: amino acid ABC transporter substrate-binding protein [Alphaproteobacteria bacterium]|nr:MAG: amino acid ABC transporter substrate-binding protein [Alphaproteobacteria bacterium]
MIKKFFLAALCILTACGGGDKQNTLRVGVSPDFPPFAMKVEGELRGHDIDMMEKVGEKLGRKIIFKEMDFSALIPALLAKKIDVAISGVSPTKERREKVLFTRPYYGEENCILFNTDKKLFKTVQDITDQTKVAATLGVTQQAIVEKHFKMHRFYNNNFQMVEDLKIGRIDVVIIGKEQCIKFKEKYPNLDFFTLPKKYNQDSYFAIAVRKDLKELVGELDTIIKNDL